MLANASASQYHLTHDEEVDVCLVTESEDTKKLRGRYRVRVWRRLESTAMILAEQLPGEAPVEWGATKVFNITMAAMLPGVALRHVVFVEAERRNPCGFRFFTWQFQQMGGPRPRAMGGCRKVEIQYSSIHGFLGKHVDFVGDVA